GSSSVSHVVENGTPHRVVEKDSDKYDDNCCNERKSASTRHNRSSELRMAIDRALMRRIATTRALFSKPDNATERGGERLIFMSWILSDYLTGLITRKMRAAADSSPLLSRPEDEPAGGAARINGNVLPFFGDAVPVAGDRFLRVNHVFRMNIFPKGSEKFKAHFDTPFVHASKGIFSRYTLLIYLTRGKSF
ncbi:unnamed protein product, partial [Amoebophrya sp. A25]